MKLTDSLENFLRVASSRQRLLAKTVRELKHSRDGASWTATSVVGALELLDASSIDNELLLLRNSLLDDWRPRAKEEVLQLDNRIRMLCATEGWVVDGQWPVLYIERAIEVRFDDRKTQLTIAGDRLGALNIGAIRRGLAARIAVLVPPKFSASDFLKQVAAAYDALSTDRVRPVPILEIYRHLVLATQSPGFRRDARRDRFRELSADQFRARLTRSLDETRDALSSGRRVRLLPPIEPSDAIFLYQPVEQRFCWIGRIEFVQPT